MVDMLANLVVRSFYPESPEPKIACTLILFPSNESIYQHNQYLHEFRGEDVNAKTKKMGFHIE